MVISSGEEGEEGEEEDAAAEQPTSLLPRSTTRPRRLHNFSFPTLSWGVQRLLLCSNSTANAAETDGSVGHQEPPTKPPARKESEEEEASSSAVAAAAASRPWNLRTRRAVCIAPPRPPVESNGRPRSNSPSSRSLSPSPLPLQAEENQSGGASKSVLLRSEGGGAVKGERRKFSLSLSKEEIEEDFLLLKGSRPPRRPKKRPRIVQRQLDLLFPGLWLTEVTSDTYKIKESMVNRQLLRRECSQGSS